MPAEHTEMSRLGEHGSNASALQVRAGAFLAEARAVEGLTDSEIGLIERRLSQRKPERRRPYLLPALAGLALLLACGSVLALIGVWNPRLPRVSSKTTVPLPVGHGAARPAPGTSAPLLREPAPARLDLSAAPVPALEGRTAPSRREEPHPELPASLSDRPPTSLTPAPRPARDMRRSAHQDSPAPLERPLSLGPGNRLPESPVSAEAQSLAEALAGWRRKNDAEAALVMLAAHERRFANGAFAVEAKIAKVEILLTLGRRSQALLVLDSLDLGALPRARELQTVRGELRSNAGHCQAARDDLNRVLVEGGTDLLGQRAARALAKCP